MRRITTGARLVLFFCIGRFRLKSIDIVATMCRTGILLGAFSMGLDMDISKQGVWSLHFLSLGEYIFMTKWTLSLL